MKNVITCFMVFAALAFIITGCGHDGGQVTIPDGTGEVSIESMVDSTGASLEGATIDPGKTIIVTFASTVSSIIAYLECDGDAVDLDVIPIAANQFGLFPKVGRFPQKTTCILSVHALEASASTNVSANASVSTIKSFNTETFDIGCDVLDTFDNLKTFDRTAASLAYGSGCWKFNESGSVDMLSGLLLFDDLVNPADNVAPMFYKRTSGSNYTIELAGVNSLYDFDTTLGRSEAVMYVVGISQDFTEFFTDAPMGAVYAGFVVRYENVGDVIEFTCTAGGSSYLSTDLKGCGDGSVFPNIGIIREGQTFTPYYSFDGGVTKRLFDLVDADTSIDLSAYITADEDMDIGMLIVGDHVGVYGSVSMGELIVTGDAEFVAE